MRHENEIDLFELLLELWNGKWTVVLITLASLIVGAVYVVFQLKNTPSSFQSSIHYSVSNLPPFFRVAKPEAKALADLQSLVSSDEIFEKWKKNNLQAKFGYEAFVPTINVNGVALYNEDRAFSFSEKSIFVKSGDLSQLKEFHSYLKFVDSELTARYIDTAEAEIKFAEQLLLDRATADCVAIIDILSLRRYIDAAKSGSETFLISHPTRPIDVRKKPKIGLLVVLFTFLGGFIGAAYVLIRNEARRRKKI